MGKDSFKESRTQVSALAEKDKPLQERAVRQAQEYGDVVGRTGKGDFKATDITITTSKGGVFLEKHSVNNDGWWQTFLMPRSGPLVHSVGHGSESYYFVDADVHQEILTELRKLYPRI